MVAHHDVIPLDQIQTNRVCAPSLDYFMQHYPIPYKPKGLSSIGDLTFNSPIEPWDKLSEREKLLLMGYSAETSFNGSLLIWSLCAARAYSQYWDNPPQDAYPTVINASGSSGASLYGQNERAIASMISPVTGKPIEVEKAKFSPGNAYIRALTIEETKELVAKSPELDRWWNYSFMSWGKGNAAGEMTTLTGRKLSLKDISPRPSVLGEHPPYLVYVRLYGEKGVLLEGPM